MAQTGHFFFFFLVAIKVFSFKKMIGLLSFFLLFVCDSFLLFWEYPSSKPAYYIAHILVISFLIYLTVRELKWPKLSIPEASILLVFFAVNFLILHFLGNVFNEGISHLGLKILFYINGFLILLLVMAAFFYSVYFANKVSALFFLAVMGLTISDLLLFGIYFADLPELRFVDNAFYSLGLGFLIQSYHEYKKFKNLENLEIEEMVEEKTETAELNRVYK